MNSGIALKAFQLKPMAYICRDNPSKPEVLVEMLKRYGLQADAVQTAKKSSRLSNPGLPIVVLMIQDAGMDGITATQVIRKLRPEND